MELLLITKNVYSSWTEMVSLLVGLEEQKKGGALKLRREYYRNSSVFAGSKPVYFPAEYQEHGY